MNKKLLINETINWITKNNFDFFITLHFKTEVSREKAEQILDSFLRKINNEIFGNRSRKSLIQVPFIERNSYDNSFHIHILCENPAHRTNRKKVSDLSKFKKIIKETWRLSAPEAAIKNMTIYDPEPLWIKPIENAEKLCSYLLKQINIDNFDVVGINNLNFNGER